MSIFWGLVFGNTYRPNHLLLFASDGPLDVIINYDFANKRK